MRHIKWILALAALSLPLAHAQIIAQFIDGVPQASAWPTGGDACGKLRNSLVWALANGQPLVNATGFSGVQACASDPFGGLNPTIAAPLNLTVKLGAVHFQVATGANWTITNSALTIEGMGIDTQVEYTGASCTSSPTTCAVLYAHAEPTGVTNGLEQVNLKGIFFYGGASNIYDAVILKDVNRSRIQEIYAWGAAAGGCGIHTEGTDEDTFDRLTVSSREAAIALSGSHATPTNGLCYDKSFASGNFTQNATILNPRAEGVSGIGWYYMSAQANSSMGGTSEANNQGIVLAASAFNKFNFFANSDVEGNGANATGEDVSDQGQGNTYINLLATSHCTATCYSVNLVGGGANWLQGGDIGDGVNNLGFTGAGSNGNVPVSETVGGGCAVVGTWVQVIQGTTIYIPYCTSSGGGGGGGGTNVEVNGGSALTTANLNGTTPAAPGGNQNVTWQLSGSSVSAYIPLSLLPSNNLSDLANVATARSNLGLGTAATQASSAFDPAGAATTAQSNAEAASDPSGSASAAQAAAIAASDPAGSATTAQSNAESFTSTSYAPLASPALSGVPTAPTATTSTNTTQVATTAEALATAQAAVPANTTAFAQPQTAPAFFPSLIATGPQANYFDDFLTTSNWTGASIGSPTGQSCNTGMSTYIAANAGHPGLSVPTSGTGGTGTGEACTVNGTNTVYNIDSAIPWTFETEVFCQCYLRRP